MFFDVSVTYFRAKEVFICSKNVVLPHCLLCRFAKTRQNLPQINSSEVKV